MEAISELRERILELYSKYETYITPVVRFLIALVSILMINSGLGYMDRLTNIIIVIVVSLIAAFLPLNFTIVIDALFILLHLYSLSITVAAIVFFVFLIMFVLYFRFTPKEAIAVVLTPVCFAIKVPYIMPLMLGFIGGPVSFVSACAGAVVYYIIKSIGADDSAFSSSFTADTALTGFKAVIDNVLNNKTMILMVIVFALIAILTNVIKRLSFDYSWQVALAVSSISGLIVLIIGSSALDSEISIVGAIFSMLISAVIVFVLQLFINNVDYSRAEYVQFQDEEYVYYVKAIPRYGVVSTKNKNNR